MNNRNSKSSNAKDASEITEININKSIMSDGSKYFKKSDEK